MNAQQIAMKVSESFGGGWTGVTALESLLAIDCDFLPINSDIIRILCTSDVMFRSLIQQYWNSFRNGILPEDDLVNNALNCLEIKRDEFKKNGLGISDHAKDYAYYVISQIRNQRDASETYLASCLIKGSEIYCPKIKEHLRRGFAEHFGVRPLDKRAKVKLTKDDTLEGEQYLNNCWRILKISPQVNDTEVELLEREKQGKLEKLSQDVLANLPATYFMLGRTTASICLYFMNFQLFNRPQIIPHMAASMLNIKIQDRGLDF